MHTGSAVTITRAPLPRADIDALCARFEDAHPTAIIRWAVEQFGSGLCMTTSFADTMLIDLATSVEPDIEVIFLDTGFHFAETIQTQRRAQARYALNLQVVRPPPDAADVWADGSDACCGDRKVRPLDDALLDGHTAWMSGLRRADSRGRAGTPIVEVDRRGLVKVNPIATWTDEQVATYSADCGVIVNPLASEGYESIGCWPCTDPPALGADRRAGRWAGLDKTECGIHL